MELTLKKRKRNTIIPGFSLTLGYTMLYLSVIVLLPLSMVFFNTLSMSWSEFWETIVHPRAVASYKLSFGTALAAGLINVVFGTIIAWVLVRYQFPGKRIVDGLVDLPFTLPTAVAGIAPCIHQMDGLASSLILKLPLHPLESLLHLLL